MKNTTLVKLSILSPTHEPEEDRYFFQFLLYQLNMNYEDK